MHKAIEELYLSALKSLHDNYIGKTIELSDGFRIELLSYRMDMHYGETWISHLDFTDDDISIQWNIKRWQT